MIHPFCYVCPRDWALFANLMSSWRRIGQTEDWIAFYDRHEEQFIFEKMRTNAHPGLTYRQRPDQFHPWSGWPHAMSKLEGWRQMSAQPWLENDDYILYCDSDTYFFTSAILSTLEDYDFIGFPHSELKYVSQLGRDWSWLSGCFQAARVGFVREAVNIDYRALEKCRLELLENKFSHNEDVVMSYIFAKMGAKEHRLDARMWMEDRAEQAFSLKIRPKSFTHMNHGEQDFLGTHIRGKWEIPMALEKAGILA